MQELQSYFSPPQFVIFGLWAVMTIFAWSLGRRREPLYMLCLISVAGNVGYICPISFGILGAGYEKGLLLPSFDAFIGAFLFMLFGLPLLIVAIVVLVARDI